ncbi:unnamed protein product [Meloidogyne enterolobii]|uniref:Uncharacterized protein n=1 Tax=Meloidogyne enterolobii TaxID=390850 RepID=A0ACB0Y3D0_MELEN
MMGTILSGHSLFTFKKAQVEDANLFLSFLYHFIFLVFFLFTFFLKNFVSKKISFLPSKKFIFHNFSIVNWLYLFSLFAPFFGKNQFQINKNVHRIRPLL